MKQNQRDLGLIEVILNDVEVMNERIQFYKVTEDSFKNDLSFEGQAAFDLVMMPVYRIAEDALHLSDNLMDRHPDFDWDDIRGFRNFVAHGYRNIDRDIAWSVVIHDIPELEKMLKKEKTLIQQNISKDDDN